MDNASRVQIVDRFGNLVQNIFAVSFSKNIFGSCYLKQICIHILKQKIDVLPVASFENIE